MKEPVFGWSKTTGYECSSKGDIHFSAFGAYLEDGRNIECWYQGDVKGYDPGGNQWKRGKGKPPLIPMSSEALWQAYLALWRRWSLAHPHLLFELRCRALEHNGVLRDSFANTPINQARALSVILNEEDVEHLTLES